MKTLCRVQLFPSQPENPQAAPQTKITKQSRGAKLLRLAVFAFVLAFIGAVAEAQQPKKFFRIGYLSNSFPSTESDRAKVIRQRLRELGYTEGQNLSIDYRYGEGNRERASELAADLVALNCDVIIVAAGYSYVRAVMEKTKTIPIVMTGGGLDPVEGGVVKSLARPGANVTGITTLSVDLAGKRLELFKEALPKLARVAVLYEAANPANALVVKKDLPALARALKLSLRYWNVQDPEDFQKIFAEIDKQRQDGFFVAGGGGLFNTNAKRIASFALNSKLPSMFPRRIDVELGGLMAYGADIEESHRQVVWYVDRILKGAKPADLPVQQPMRFEFVFNLQTAKKIGVTINTDVLARATKIIR